MLGCLIGSSLLHSPYLSNLEERIVSTEYGDVVLHFGKNVVFCQRHHADPKRDYTPPHLINKKAIISSFVKSNVTQVIGFGSVGSLKVEIPIGTLLIPNDIFNLWDSISFFEDKRAHIVPNLETEFRQEAIDVLRKEFPALKTEGTYVQTTGPRFESRAEIRFLSSVADVVGMTAVHESVLCAEMQLPYVLVTMVDNMGNGIVAQDLSSAFQEGIRKNQQTVERVLALLLQHFAK